MNLGVWNPPAWCLPLGPGSTVFADCRPPAVLDPNIPWWCGVSDLLGIGAESCRVPTPNEIRTSVRPGPAMLPENVQRIEDETTRLWAAYCEMHPAECREYEESTVPVDWTKWALLAAAAVTALVLIGRR